MAHLSLICPTFSHPDVDLIEDRVSQITVRWDNVNSQVAERLRIAEEAQQTQMVYRSQYTEEVKDHPKKIFQI